VALNGITDLISGLLGQTDFTGASLAVAGYPGSGVEALNFVSVVGSLALVGGLGIWMVAGILHITAAKNGSVA
jgi:hypothetical protein